MITFLLQVSKKLEKTARHFKNVGTLGFWSQLVCTVVSAGILSFSVVATGNVTAPFTFSATAVGIVVAFICVFRSFGYIRLSERLKRTANDPSKVLLSLRIVVGLQHHFLFFSLYGTKCFCCVAYGISTIFHLSTAASCQNFYTVLLSYFCVVFLLKCSGHAFEPKKTKIVFSSFRLLHAPMWSII